MCVLATVIAGLGCGDDSERCGEGTVESNGVCLPTLVTTCGDGTKLENGQCVIDPDSCQGGTVLIGGRCVDPTRAPVVDLEESAEPNGFAVAAGVEASTTPAGTITLAGTAQFVVHGHITPFRDSNSDGQLDPDVDTYLLSTAQSVVLAISVDGVGGAQGAFYVAGDPAGPVPAYERYGLNLTGDTAQRKLVLPAAGRYAIAITDTRSLAIGGNPPRPAGAGGAAGGSQAEYYATIAVQPVTASELTGSGTLTATGALATDEIQLFTAALGSGQNEIRHVMAGAAAASLTVVRGGELLGYADERSAPPGEARVTVTGVAAGERAQIFVDTVFHYGPGPEPFALTITRADAGSGGPGSR